VVNGWEIALISYMSTAAATFLPVLYVLLRRATLYDWGPAFADSPHFSDAAKERLSQNFQRIQGTLTFWKTEAIRYKAFHIYAVVWITVSTVAVPFIAQSVNSSNPWSKWCVSIIGAFAALLLALSRAFRVENIYKGFRQGESDFYDTYRRLLDTPRVFGRTEEDQLRSYFSQVERIRRGVRSTETDDLPSVEGAAPHHDEPTT